MANKILNELGKIVFAEGSDFSIARMRVKYPKTLAEMVQIIRNERAWSDIRSSTTQRDLIFLMEDNKVDLDDYKILITTAINDSKYEEV